MTLVMHVASVPRMRVLLLVEALHPYPTSLPEVPSRVVMFPRFLRDGLGHVAGEESLTIALDDRLRQVTGMSLMASVTICEAVNLIRTPSYAEPYSQCWVSWAVQASCRRN
jgi:hypothetical protein